MAVIWAPETEGDFDRIREYNAEHYGEAEADIIEGFIDDYGELIGSGDGLPWTGLSIRRVRTKHPIRHERISYMYNLFFRERGGDVEIFAVYHVREEWDVLVPARAMPTP